MTNHRLSPAQWDKNKQLFKQLKRKPPKNLDDTVHKLHTAIFEKTDCLACANCCKTTSPVFRSGDIDRIAKKLRMKPSAFIEQYLNIDEEQDYVLKQSPCAFLDNENYCTIYEVRPTACREYPHTDRKRIHQLMDLTLRNTQVCPAVQQISEALQKIFAA